MVAYLARISCDGLTADREPCSAVSPLGERLHIEQELRKAGWVMVGPAGAGELHFCPACTAQVDVFRVETHTAENGDRLSLHLEHVWDDEVAFSVFVDQSHGRGRLRHRCTLHRTGTRTKVTGGPSGALGRVAKAEVRRVGKLIWLRRGIGVE